MKTTQSYIARQIGVSVQAVNLWINAKKRPNWKRAKQLAKVTGTNPIIWLEGTSHQIKRAINPDYNSTYRLNQDQGTKNSHKSTIKNSKWGVENAE